MGNKLEKMEKLSRTAGEEEVFTQELVLIKDKIHDILLQQSTNEKVATKKRRHSSGETILVDFWEKNSNFITNTLENIAKIQNIKVMSLKEQLDVSFTEIRLLKDKVKSTENELSMLKSLYEKMQMDTKNELDLLNSKICLLDANIGIERKDEYSKLKKPTLRKIQTSRMYCDNCEFFDDHETEDCSYGFLPVIQVEPFCTICEISGHSSKNCNDSETY